MPSCRKATISERLAKPGERQRLGLDADARVFQIRRDRFIDGAVAVREVIVISADLFRGLDKRQPLPNTLYTLYQAEFGVSIVSASEQIESVRAGRDDAEALGIEAGAPLLEINRTAYDITGRAIELRQSRFASGKLVYSVELR